MTDRLLPDVTLPRTAPFWEGLRDGRLVLQRCAACGYVRWPASPRGAECLTVGGEWTEVRATGLVWSYAVYHRAFHPSFRDQVPYIVVAVELDDGPMLIARFADGDGHRPAIGSRVVGVFESVTPDVTLLRWKEDA